ncbi:hypothetical protein Taro_050835 [Colocasia esculenta]|uniref:Uncharacterized protein n=1 Tax=Colocasia esculenta TaxID=4460 RepID=A0A843XF10_COLES|nr:hypothetical protein [Colocasia esculenta]
MQVATQSDPAQQNQVQKEGNFPLKKTWHQKVPQEDPVLLSSGNRFSVLEEGEDNNEGRQLLTSRDPDSTHVSPQEPASEPQAQDSLASPSVTLHGLYGDTISHGVQHLDPGCNAGMVVVAVTNREVARSSVNMEATLSSLVTVPEEAEEAMRISRAKSSRFFPKPSDADLEKEIPRNVGVVVASEILWDRFMSPSLISMGRAPVLVNSVNKDKALSWNSYRWWRDAKQLFSRASTQLSHVYLETNQLADSLANLAVKNKKNDVFWGGGQVYLMLEAAAVGGSTVECGHKNAGSQFASLGISSAAGSWIRRTCCAIVLQGEEAKREGGGKQGHLQLQPLFWEMGIPSELRDTWASRRGSKQSPWISSPSEPRVSASESTVRDAVTEGMKRASIAGAVAAVPTLVGCRVIPWAKANLNYTAQALIISAASIAAFFITADKTILKGAKKNSRDKFDKVVRENA